MTQSQPPVAHTLDGLPIFLAQRVPQGQAQPWGVTASGQPIWPVQTGAGARGGPSPLGVLSNGEFVYGTMDARDEKTPLWRKKRVLIPLALLILLGLGGALSPDESDNLTVERAAGEQFAAPLRPGGGVAQQDDSVVAKQAAADAAAAAAKQTADAVAAKQAAEAAATKQAADAAAKTAAEVAAAKQVADATAARDAAAAATEQAARVAAAQQAADASAAQQAAEAVEPAAPAGQRFANCPEMQETYPHGVGRPGATDKTSGSAPVTTFTRSAALYEANSGSDRDGDEIACEKR